MNGKELESIFKRLFCNCLAFEVKGLDGGVSGLLPGFDSFYYLQYNDSIYARIVRA